MRIAIFGSGGVGGYFGGRLAQAGEDVIFIARGEHLRAIRQNGLSVDSTSWAIFSFHPHRRQTTLPRSAGWMWCWWRLKLGRCRKPPRR